jgi:hypothetical protein
MDRPDAYEGPGIVAPVAVGDRSGVKPPLATTSPSTGSPRSASSIRSTTEEGSPPLKDSKGEAHEQNRVMA